MITPDQIGLISDQIVKSRVTKPVITENSKFYFPKNVIDNQHTFWPDSAHDYPHHPIKPINPNFRFSLVLQNIIMATGWSGSAANEKLSMALLTNQRPEPGDTGQRQREAPWCDQLSYKSRTRDNQSQIQTIECDIQPGKEESFQPIEERTFKQRVKCSMF